MITAGIATLPEREESLKQVVESLYDQVDRIVIALNLYSEVPSWVKTKEKIVPILANNYAGDAGKFFGVSIADGVYFACDDDLLYPKDYVNYMLDGINNYSSVVSLHGKIYSPPVTSFKAWKVAYRCLGSVSRDVYVNVIGSGCCAFHRGMLQLDMSDFPFANMADILLSKKATEQKVPMVVLKHDVGYLKYLPPPSGTTIWEKTKDYSRHTMILKSFIK